MFSLRGEGTSRSYLSKNPSHSTVSVIEPDSSYTRPSAVEVVSMGLVSPKPIDTRREASFPCFASQPFTTSGRRLEKGPFTFAPLAGGVVLDGEAERGALLQKLENIPQLRP